MLICSLNNNHNTAFSVIWVAHSFGGHGISKKKHISHHIRYATKQRRIKGNDTPSLIGRVSHIGKQHIVVNKNSFAFTHDIQADITQIALFPWTQDCSYYNMIVVVVMRLKSHSAIFPCTSWGRLAWASTIPIFRHTLCIYVDERVCFISCGRVWCALKKTYAKYAKIVNGIFGGSGCLKIREFFRWSHTRQNIYEKQGADKSQAASRCQSNMGHFRPASYLRAGWFKVSHELDLTQFQTLSHSVCVCGHCLIKKYGCFFLGVVNGGAFFILTAFLWSQHSTVGVFYILVYYANNMQLYDWYDDNMQKYVRCWKVLFEKRT